MLLSMCGLPCPHPRVLCILVPLTPPLLRRLLWGKAGEKRLLWPRPVFVCITDVVGRVVWSPPHLSGKETLLSPSPPSISALPRP